VVGGAEIVEDSRENSFGRRRVELALRGFRTILLGL
jgi:hypothetical protein